MGNKDSEDDFEIDPEFTYWDPVEAAARYVEARHPANHGWNPNDFDPEFREELRKAFLEGVEWFRFLADEL